jgi:hypothetical protein
MRLLISFAALFLSVILLQLGAGGVAPLDAISGLALGFSAAEVGLLGSAHFVGFFIGCWWAPRLMGDRRPFPRLRGLHRRRHHRHPRPHDAGRSPRLGSDAHGVGLLRRRLLHDHRGWLQAKVTNETRGRAMGSTGWSTSWARWARSS